MAYAINIRSDDASSSVIRALWGKCSALEDSPSMEALNYPPHITLAIYDDIGVDTLIATVESVFEGVERMRIRFDKLGYFEGPDAIILWAAPVLPDVARRVHERIHSEIDPGLCRPHYRPGSWLPHCSLALTVNPGRKKEALSMVEKPIEPMEVVFDVADCASFLPVHVLHEKVLGAVRAA